MRRVLSLAVVVATASLVVVPAAAGWVWPADGPVLRPFSLAEDEYAAGQHRGLDIAAATGADVRAPASGTVTFSGSVPGGGRALTIQTSDGLAVTLLQLASVAVPRGAGVAEGAVVGTVGASEDAVTAAPHVHLGIRVATEPNGYVDPARLLPARAVVPAAEPVGAAAPEPAPATVVEPEPASAPVESAGSAAPPSPVAAPAAVVPASRVAASRTAVVRAPSPNAKPTPAARPTPSVRPRVASAPPPRVVLPAKPESAVAEAPEIAPEPSAGPDALSRRRGRRPAGCSARRDGARPRTADRLSRDASRRRQAARAHAAGARLRRPGAARAAPAPARRRRGCRRDRGSGRPWGCAYH